MIKNPLTVPAMSALGILKEYHSEVEKKLKDAGIEDAASHIITTDIYAKDDLYFSLNRAYEHIPVSFDEFCRKNELHTSLSTMFPEIANGKYNLYTHQENAIRSILADQTTIISTGTGSGKTEAFLIPILHHCLLQKASNISGIKAIILYPLNALANDQIGRILKAVRGKGIRVGCFVGSTPRQKKRKQDDQAERCISRQEMMDDPPDILITNYVMLDRLLTKAETRTMFVKSKQTLKYIVVDEIHYFRGTKGANLSLLLRRLRTLCKVSLVQVGASGTLRHGGGYFLDSEEERIKQFAQRIFGQEAVTQHGFQLIEPMFQREQQKELDALPDTEDIIGESFLRELDGKKAQELYKQLAKSLHEEKREPLHIEETTMYRFLLCSPYLKKIRTHLTEGTKTFGELVKLFAELYENEYRRVPRNPKAVVEAYLSVIGYVNQRCAERNIPLPLDYRLHLILGDVGDALTRCLLCGTISRWTMPTLPLLQQRPFVSS